jgi:hypothetical protein
VVPVAVQAPPQHGCPAAPQPPQLPDRHARPAAQAAPSATQLPCTSRASVCTQQPVVHRLNAQQGWPGSPQREQAVWAGASDISAAAAFVTRQITSSGAQAGCPRSAPGQHAAPARPQPSHRPALQVPYSRWPTTHAAPAGRHWPLMQQPPPSQLGTSPPGANGQQACPAPPQARQAPRPSIASTTTQASPSPQATPRQHA